MSLDGPNNFFSYARKQRAIKIRNGSWPQGCAARTVYPKHLTPLVGEPWTVWLVDQESFRKDKCISDELMIQPLNNLRSYVKRFFTIFLLYFSSNIFIGWDNKLPGEYDVKVTPIRRHHQGRVKIQTQELI